MLFFCPTCFPTSRPRLENLPGLCGGSRDAHALDAREDEEAPEKLRRLQPLAHEPHGVVEGPARGRLAEERNTCPERKRMSKTLLKASQYVSLTPGSLTKCHEFSAETSYSTVKELRCTTPPPTRNSDARQAGEKRPSERYGQCIKQGRLVIFTFLLVSSATPVAGGPKRCQRVQRLQAKNRCASRHRSCRKKTTSATKGSSAGTHFFSRLAPRSFAEGMHQNAFILSYPVLLCPRHGCKTLSNSSKIDHKMGSRGNGRGRMRSFGELRHQIVQALLEHVRVALLARVAVEPRTVTNVTR